MAATPAPPARPPGPARHAARPRPTAPRCRRDHAPGHCASPARTDRRSLATRERARDRGRGRSRRHRSAGQRKPAAAADPGSLHHHDDRPDHQHDRGRPVDDHHRGAAAATAQHGGHNHLLHHHHDHRPDHQHDRGRPVDRGPRRGAAAHRRQRAGTTTPATAVGHRAGPLVELAAAGERGRVRHRSRHPGHAHPGGPVEATPPPSPPAPAPSAPAAVALRRRQLSRAGGPAGARSSRPPGRRRPAHRRTRGAARPPGRRPARAGSGRRRWPAPPSSSPARPARWRSRR